MLGMLAVAKMASGNYRQSTQVAFPHLRDYVDKNIMKFIFQQSLAQKGGFVSIASVSNCIGQNPSPSLPLTQWGIFLSCTWPKMIEHQNNYKPDAFLLFVQKAWNHQYTQKYLTLPKAQRTRGLVHVTSSYTNLDQFSISWLSINF